MTPFGVFVRPLTKGVSAVNFIFVCLMVSADLGEAMMAQSVTQLLGPWAVRGNDEGSSEA